MFSKYFRHFSQAWTVKDSYSVLGLKYGASHKEIRAAYLSLAKKFHPDSPTGDTEKFKIVAHAYEVLNDPRQKQNNLANKENTPKKDVHENQHNWYEEEEKAYREWRENRSWNQSAREANFDSQGYEYNDPFIRQTERYTFSQYRKDRYNKVYKEPSRPARPHKTEQNESSSFFSVFLAFGALCFLTAR